MRAAVLPFVLLVSACSIHRTPGWARPTTGVVDPSPDELVRRSRETFRRGVTLSGRAALAAFDEAVSLAERALHQRNPLFRDKVKRREPPSWLFPGATLADLPALVAYGEALLEWARRQGTGTLLEEQDRIRQALFRAYQLDRNYDHAAPDRLLGTLFSILPVGAGADFVHALEHFEAACAADPSYLPNQLAYAVEYAGPLREDKLYRKLLDQILAADPAQLPPPEAENRAALDRARVLRSAVR